MMTTAPVESYGELVDRFPGIDELEPSAIGRFVFHAALHAPTESFAYGRTDEPKREWHYEIRDILNSVSYWRENPDGVSRFDLARRIESRIREAKEELDLIQSFDALPADEAYKITMQYLSRRGFGVVRRLAESPLFPDGRTLFTPIEAQTDISSEGFYLPYGASLETPDGTTVSDEIKEFVTTDYPIKRTQEEVLRILDTIEPIDQAELDELTSKYGAKAAALVCFEKRAHQFNEQTAEMYNTIDIEIPPFTAVSTEMFDAWRTDEALFEEMVELTRQDALQLLQTQQGKLLGGLVAIRSSAVFSEDGQSSTGAGVYTSLAVDPSDSVAFRDAVTQVYLSANSQAALSYRRQLGMSEERMGLLIQAYIEEGKSSYRDRGLYWGNANSRGANPNLVDVNTNEGTLLFDKNSVLSWLLVEAKNVGRHGGDNPHIHTYPDHDSALRGAIHSVKDIPHAVVLAEKLFGKPMQVEFVNRKVVQVRPIVGVEFGEAVEFPDDDHVAELASVGVGDMHLGYLSRHEDNTGREGYIVFDEEYEYSLQGTYANMRGLDYVGYAAFPDKGAVIILNPSSSGHIQAICREKGLLCVFPAKNKEGVTGSRELDELLHDFEDRHYAQRPKKQPFRFVSDGYEARLYVLPSAISE